MFNFEIMIWLVMHAKQAKEILQHNDGVRIKPLTSEIRGECSTT